MARGLVATGVRADQDMTLNLVETQESKWDPQVQIVAYLSPLRLGFFHRLTLASRILFCRGETYQQWAIPPEQAGIFMEMLTRYMACRDSTN